MQPHDRSRLFGFTTEAAIDRFEYTKLPRLHILAEYNSDVYRDLYVDDGVVEALGGEAAYERQRDLVGDFLRLDLLERNAYSDLVPRAGPVELLVTQAADLMFVRTFREDDALFLSIERNGSIDMFVELAEGLVGDG